MNCFEGDFKMQFKRLLIGIFALVTLSFTSLQADHPPFRYVEPYHYRWNGVYAGFHGGYSWTEFAEYEQSFVLFGPRFEKKISNGKLGGHFGFNTEGCCDIFFRCSFPIVFSIEVSVDWTDEKKTNTVAVPLFEGNLIYHMRADFMGTITQRIGFPFCNWMPYVKAGVAIERVKHRFFIESPTLTLSGFRRNTLFCGPTWGGGVEYAWNCNWLIGVETNWYYFPRKRFSGNLAPELGIFVTPAVMNKVRAHGGDVLFRLTYLF